MPLTPPLTPENAFIQDSGSRCPPSIDGQIEKSLHNEFASIPELDLDAGAEPSKYDTVPAVEEKCEWRKGMSEEEKDQREGWLAGGRGRKGLRIVIVTENFLPKVDGVTRTLSRLLEHLHSSGHQCILLGPSSTLSSYASHPLVGTLGIPLVVYPGLKLNFLRPKFLSVIRDWEPDVVHFVDPIWLGAQTILAMELGWAGDSWVGQGGPELGKGLGGAVVASYHTNLATYATLFGMSFLTPIIWAFQSSLYSKLLLTLCPSPSTRSMLKSQSFEGVRLWPRGVDLSQFGPSKRCTNLRREWGILPVATEARSDMSMYPAKAEMDTLTPTGLMTPPMTPWSGPVDGVAERSSAGETGEERVVLSWEKNLQLLLSAYAKLPCLLPESSTMPKLVFVGDGPARADLATRCEKEGWDAVFMGHRSGEELAKCYASGDVFAFPSFTETFGQVVLEALASGLPVVGLDAEGTRDLVSHRRTGLLLALPNAVDKSGSPLNWAKQCNPASTHFDTLARSYADLLAQAVANHGARREMGRRGSTEGIEGYTWWDAMEACVDGYRESMRIARSRRSVQVVPHPPPSEQQLVECLYAGANDPVENVKPRRGLSMVNRVVSRRLAYKSVTRGLRSRQCKQEKQGGFKLRALLRVVMALCLVYALYVHHRAKLGSFMEADELLT
ncbi:hypothetical protein IAU60_003147 [Kwoniella sp. DSM 27419]